jgi:hypothetical protein
MWQQITPLVHQLVFVPKDDLTPLQVSCAVEEDVTQPGTFEIYICGEKIGAPFHGTLEDAKMYAMWSLSPLMFKLQTAVESYQRALQK